jgi:hypothetical protein
MSIHRSKSCRVLEVLPATVLLSGCVARVPFSSRHCEAWFCCAPAAWGTPKGGEPPLAIWQGPARLLHTPTTVYLVNASTPGKAFMQESKSAATAVGCHTTVPGTNRRAR